MCKCVGWGKLSLARPVARGEKEKGGRREGGSGVRGETGLERRERARVFPFPTLGQFPFVAGLPTGSLSICLNANIPNILFGCS